MADSSLAHPDNAQGEFFIDTTCIDCPICRQTAPAIFGDGPGQALVIRQPEDLMSACERSWRLSPVRWGR